MNSNNKNSKSTIRSRSNSLSKPKVTKPIKKSETMTKTPSVTTLKTTKDKKKITKTNTSKSIDKGLKKPKTSKSVNIKPADTSRNIDVINRLINNSQEILSQQNTLLDKYEDLSKKVTSSDYEIDRLLNKNENDEFNNFLEKYSGNLSHIMQKLKSHTEEVENIKCKIAY